MIETAVFALIRDEQTTIYREPFGAALLSRNLVWGSDALEEWLSTRNAIDDFDYDCEAGVVVDYDAKAILWYAPQEWLEHPRSFQLLDRLVEHAWPDFEILYADSLSDLQIAAGDSLAHANGHALSLREDDSESQEFHRGETLDDEIESEDEWDPDDEDERFAWITILDPGNSVHHRLIGEITMDIISNRGNPIERLKGLRQYDVPAEQNVVEGMVIDETSKTIDLWGGRDIIQVIGAMADRWPGWTIERLDSDAYDAQCRISGPAGRPLSAEQALGDLVPLLLLTKRIDPSMLIGAIGKSFKGLMVRLVAFGTMLVCLPFAIFALVTGNWKVGGITIGIVVALVVIVFKIIEAKWRKGFAKTMAESSLQAEPGDEHLPVVAGPMDPIRRRIALDELLLRADMPTVQAIEPFFNTDWSEHL